MAQAIQCEPGVESLGFQLEPDLAPRRAEAAYDPRFATRVDAEGDGIVVLENSAQRRGCRPVDGFSGFAPTRGDCAVFVKSSSARGQSR
jgi:hypothetical protein